MGENEANDRLTEQDAGSEGTIEDSISSNDVHSVNGLSPEPGEKEPAVLNETSPEGEIASEDQSEDDQADSPEQGLSDNPMDEIAKEDSINVDELASSLIESVSAEAEPDFSNMLAQIEADDAQAAAATALAAQNEILEEEPEEQEVVEAEPEDGRHWYVVHCYSGYENKVRHNLEQRIETMGMKDRIFDVVVPTEEEIEVKEGKRRTIERRVFPGYILVQMVMTEESWYVVRNTPGVTGFVGMGNEPTPLRPEEVSSIIKRMEADAPRIKVTYRTGQKVRIIDGPFNDFIGTVDDIDMERAKVRVMVSFFGRETPVELDFLQVEKA
jgi:transcription termination/antitermination protein NusG